MSKELTHRLQEGALSARKTPPPPAPTKLVSLATAAAQNGSKPAPSERE